MKVAGERHMWVLIRRNHPHASGLKGRTDTAFDTYKTAFVGSAIDTAGRALVGKWNACLDQDLHGICDCCGGRWNGVKPRAAGWKSVHVQEWERNKGKQNMFLLLHHKQLNHEGKDWSFQTELGKSESITILLCKGLIQPFVQPEELQKRTGPRRGHRSELAHWRESRGRVTLSDTSTHSLQELGWHQETLVRSCSKVPPDPGKVGGYPRLSLSAFPAPVERVPGEAGSPPGLRTDFRAPLETTAQKARPAQTPPSPQVRKMCQHERFLQDNSQMS